MSGDDVETFAAPDVAALVAEVQRLRAVEAADEGTLIWSHALVLARYIYGEHEWTRLDPEERNAVAEPYQRTVRRFLPMVRAALTDDGGR